MKYFKLTANTNSGEDIVLIIKSLGWSTVITDIARNVEHRTPNEDGFLNVTGLSIREISKDEFDTIGRRIIIENEVEY